MKRRLMAMLLACVLMISLPVCVGAEESDISGVRTVEFKADWSDLENYVNGGRSHFDLILRSILPEWASYKLRSHNRNVTLTLAFSFDSLADYKDKVTELILRTPTLVCVQEAGGLLMIDNYTSFELLNFLEEQLKELECLSEMGLDQVFHLSSSSITVNSREYPLEDAVNIHPDDVHILQMDRLAIQTEMTENYGYKRTIVAGVDMTQEARRDISGLQEQFSQVGEVSVDRESDDERTISVTFEAANQAQLERKTMLCLNAPTFIAEHQTAAADGTIRVERTEFFDLEQLLRPDGEFFYSFDLPDYCKNTADRNISARNTPFISCTYDRDLRFDAIEIHTDLSSLSGRINRTILCTLPADVAENFHESIKGEFEKHMCRGTVLDIYDEKGMRCYRFSYSAWRASDVEAFTAAILNNTAGIFEMESGWFPLCRGMIVESFDADTLFHGLLPVDRISSSYTLSDWSFFLKSMAEVEGAELSGRTVTFQIRSGSTMTVSFRYVPVVRCAVVLLLLLVVFVLLLWAVRKIRRISAGRRRKEKTNGHSAGHNRKQKTSGTSFCPYCGEKNIAESRFCGRCGKPMGDRSDR